MATASMTMNRINRINNGIENDMTSTPRGESPDQRTTGMYLDLTLPEVGLSTHVDPRKRIIELVRTINDRREKLVLDTMDQRVREGLIALGWTPPAE